MIGALSMLALAVAGGPDLAAIDAAVAKCDSRLMARTFGDEPARRRAFAIAAFAEQKEIFDARAALAARRLATADAMEPMPGAIVAGVLLSQPDDRFDRAAEALAERQRRLDDVRMLETMRDQTLDMMRAQYLSRCSGGRTSAQD
jgi:hypothetical protein